MKKFSSTMRGNSRRTWLTKRLKVILALIVFGLFLFYVVPKASRVAVSMVVEPIASVRHWFAVSEQRIPTYIRDRDSLTNQIRTLEQKLAQAEGTGVAMSYVASVQAEIQAALDLDIKSITAGVLLYSETTPYDALILDRGAADGVIVDAPVYVDNTYLIGTVASVSQTQSVVHLLSTAGVETTVFVFGPDIYTTAVGQGAGVIRIGVPQGIALTQDDVVVAPALLGGVVGALTYIESFPTSAEQYGYSTVPIALRSIHVVSIGTRSIEPITFEKARDVVNEMRTDIGLIEVPDGVLVDITTNATSTATSSSSTVLQIETTL